MNADEHQAVATTRCIFCSSPPGERCVNFGRYGMRITTARRVHTARMRMWRATQQYTPPTVGGADERGSDDGR